MELLRVGSLVAATVAMGLMAGLFAAFAYSVMPGLRRTDDRAFVAAMRRINVAILNGWFFVIFFGAAVFTVLAAALRLGADGRAALPWIVAAFVLYAAALGITIAVNVPLNNALEAAGDTAPGAELATVRQGFEAPWIRWNAARAGTSVAAFGCLTVALLVDRV